MSQFNQAYNSLQQELGSIDQNPSSFVGDSLAIGQLLADVELSLWCPETWNKTTLPSAESEKPQSQDES